MFDNFGELETSIQQKIEADADFQATLVDLSDEDKTTAMTTKKSELLDSELKSFSEKSKKNEDLANNYKKRAEKAEQEAKKSAPVEENLTQKDWLVLAKADVHEDDMEEVIEFAKFKKVSVADALKSSSLKAILSNNVEVRKSAEVAQAKPRSGGQQKPTDDVIIKKTFEKGEIPDKGSDEAEQLFWGRRGGKR